MKTIRSSIVLLAPLLALACMGCGGGARQVSIQTWQNNIEQYVRTHGKGDPTVLRDLTLSDSRRGYAMLGADRPDESTDANGLLLGFHEINGRSYFIYLVGVVKQQRVQDIRIAALATNDGRLNWKLSPPDTQALTTYRTHNEHIWKQRFPDRTTPPPQYTGFPRVEDQFQLTIVGDQITVTHPASRAQWELKLPPAPPRQA